MFKRLYEALADAEQVNRKMHWINFFGFLFFFGWVFSLASWVVHIFGNGIPKNNEGWGQFGDFLGGTLNPLLGFITVMMLGLGYLNQKAEAAANIRELSKQAFEQTLFSWLDNYGKLLALITAQNDDQTIFGREALQHLYKTNFGGAELFARFFKNRTGIQTFEKLLKQGTDQEVSRFIHVVMRKYRAFYRMYRSDFDALYRTLYRLFIWIDNSKFSASERWGYMSLVRAHLSSVEMQLLLLNSLTPTGSKLTAVANKYALFDNMDKRGDVLSSFFTRKLVENPKQFNYSNVGIYPLTADAFNSKLARGKFKEEFGGIKLRTDDLKEAS